MGSDAALVVLDSDRKMVVSASKLHSRCDYNIYDGWELIGWSVYTTVRGEVIA